MEHLSPPGEDKNQLVISLGALFFLVAIVLIVAAIVRGTPDTADITPSPVSESPSATLTRLAPTSEDDTPTPTERPTTTASPEPSYTALPAPTITDTAQPTSTDAPTAISDAPTVAPTATSTASPFVTAAPTLRPTLARPTRVRRVTPASN